VEELLAAQNEEVRVLLSLFDEEFFTDGVVAFDEDNAEVIVRACAAVRLAAAANVTCKGWGRRRSRRRT